MIKPSWESDARLEANAAIETELLSLAQDLTKPFDAASDLQDRASDDTPHDVMAIVQTVFPNNYDFQAGYEIGYYASKYILPLPNLRHNAMLASTREIMTVFTKRTIPKDSTLEQMIIDVTSDYDLPSTPTYNALDPHTQEMSYPLHPTFMEIAKKMIPETHELYCPSRDETIKRYMGGVGLAQMAVEKVWYDQRKLTERVLNEQLSR